MPISITFTGKLGDTLRASSLHVCHARRGIWLGGKLRPGRAKMLFIRADGKVV
jgi:hypothetical protein